ncbi:hypothetical protein BVRB_5g108770 [Beta vulgaris subsp. vulgaris]|nr:hypothetical protein BVRB_5g108770 [Beta vulgaris subsp. vulgaris]
MQQHITVRLSAASCSPLTPLNSLILTHLLTSLILPNSFSLTFSLHLAHSPSHLTVRLLAVRLRFHGLHVVVARSLLACRRLQKVDASFFICSPALMTRLLANRRCQQTS